MTIEIVQSAACSWVGLFAAVWLARDAHALEEDETARSDQPRQRTSSPETLVSPGSMTTSERRHLQWRAWGLAAPLPASVASRPAGKAVSSPRGPARADAE